MELRVRKDVVDETREDVPLACACNDDDVAEAVLLCGGREKGVEDDGREEERLAMLEDSSGRGVVGSDE